MSKPIFLTEEGLAALEQELEELKSHCHLVTCLKIVNMMRRKTTKPL